MSNFLSMLPAILGAAQGAPTASAPTAGPTGGAPAGGQTPTGPPASVIDILRAMFGGGGGSRDLSDSMFGHTVGAGLGGQEVGIPTPILGHHGLNMPGGAKTLPNPQNAGRYDERQRVGRASLYDPGEQPGRDPGVHPTWTIGMGPHPMPPGMMPGDDPRQNYGIPGGPPPTRFPGGEDQLFVPGPAPMPGFMPEVWFPPGSFPLGPDMPIRRPIDAFGPAIGGQAPARRPQPAPSPAAQAPVGGMSPPDHPFHGDPFGALNLLRRLSMRSGNP